MGWLGTALLAAIVGFAGWRFHPNASALGRPRGALTVAIAVAAALLVKLAGNASGAFVDGQTLEWLATVVAAIVVVVVMGRRGGRGAHP
jgi:hypothetical protein